LNLAEVGRLTIVAKNTNEDVMWIGDNTDHGQNHPPKSEFSPCFLISILG
jgi:hypothetical protein